MKTPPCLLLLLLTDLTFASDPPISPTNTSGAIEPSTINNPENQSIPKHTNEESTTADSNKDCDDSLPLRSDLYITPMDSPDSHYTISFGTHSTSPETSTTAKILKARQIGWEIVKVRDLECRYYYALTHGEFPSVRKAENEMWRLLSFPNPAPYTKITLTASIAKISPPKAAPKQ